MNKSQQTQEQPHFLLNVSMIALETFYSFILKHDDIVQLHAQQFIDQQLTVKVNCYIPYLDFYVRFTKEGILFDLQPPANEPDLEISATIFNYIQSLVLGNTRSTRSIRMYCDHAETKDKFKDLLIQLALPKLACDWKKWLFRSQQSTETIASKGRINPLLEKIEFQRSKIASLQIEVKQQKNRIRHLQSKQFRLNLFFACIIIVLSVILGYTQFMH
ncbi:hypothetical protein [Acinetobacter sp. MD2(2019)]|uniref:hypothetical protein n=1 Tax=Acinetobacter sp. MD2(2019) TaxID=2605273 RepID=UPI002D1F60EF|nr:hypothetical protein [Acinetobacter sp. MD2(2019)]MEB3754173.1 hypothetical protein [Acinetobacter sp. MD2(2019)]